MLPCGESNSARPRHPYAFGERLPYPAFGSNRVQPRFGLTLTLQGLCFSGKIIHGERREPVPGAVAGEIPVFVSLGMPKYAWHPSCSFKPPILVGCPVKKGIWRTTFWGSSPSAKRRRCTQVDKRTPFPFGFDRTSPNELGVRKPAGPPLQKPKHHKGHQGFMDVLVRCSCFPFFGTAMREAVFVPPKLCP